MNNEERIVHLTKEDAEKLLFDKDATIYQLNQLLSSKDAEIQQLKDWKESAISVMPDYQKIGELIGVKLGGSVHDKIIPAIEKYQSEIQQLKEQLRQEKDEVVDLEEQKRELRKELRESQSSATREQIEKAILHFWKLSNEAKIESTSDFEYEMSEYLSQFPQGDVNNDKK